MATGGDTFPVWDRRNKHQQGLVDSTDYKRLLRQAGVVLRRNLRTDDVLPHLLQLDVFDTIQVEGITHNAPRAVIVDRLIRFLHTCECWQFHALLRACALTGQTQLIREVGLDPTDYITEEQEDRQQTLPPALLRVIAHHCKNCERKLMKRNLYDFGDKDAVKVMDTAPCHIQVDPLYEGERGKLTEISEKDILIAFPDEKYPPRVIRLEGQPGVGKTALTHHVVYDWSIEFLKKVGKKIPIEVDGEMLTMMVHIAARDIKTTVDDAILDNLRCAKDDQPMLHRHVTKGSSSGIVLDGIDEIRNKKVMENVKEYIKERQKRGDGPRVLVTARTDLCPIDIQDFDRFLVVKGFSQSQGMSYIEAYFRNDPDTHLKVANYVGTHQQKLYPIVTNPLRLHIFCALVSEGELELDENDDFCIRKLLTLLEQSLLRREGKEVTEEQMHNFYRMCLHGLLNGLREFTKDLLDRFSIAEACHVFFTKMDVHSVLNKQETYSFPHEIMFEHFAAKCLETLPLEKQKSLLITVSSEPALRNLQKIMFQVILQQEQHQQELLLLMIRSIILLQFEPPVQRLWGPPSHYMSRKRFLKRTTLHKKLLSLKSKIREIQDLTNIKETRKICIQITKAFDDDPNLLRKLNWYEGLGNGVFAHINECLQHCSQRQREILARSTTDRLLPCIFRDGRTGWHMVHSVGRCRWAEIDCPLPELHEVFVHAWCFKDAYEILNKARLSGFSTGRGSLWLDFDAFTEMWGQPEANAFSPRMYDELNEEIKVWCAGSEDVPYARMHFGPSSPRKAFLPAGAVPRI